MLYKKLDLNYGGSPQKLTQCVPVWLISITLLFALTTLTHCNENGIKLATVQL
jgi:hypothetical protein